MKEKTPISDIKSKAKDKILGSYSVAIVSFVLLFAIIYLVMSIISSGAMSLIFAGRVGSQGASAAQIEAMLENSQMSTMLDILMYIVVGIATPFMTIVLTGFTYVCREISYGRKPKSSDLFFCIKNHPDKIIIMSLIMYVMQVILQFPAMLYESSINADEPSGQQFLIYIVLMLAGAIIRCVMNIALSQCYLIYLDNTEMTATGCLKGSLRMMKGNMWRYFYMMLSFVGYYLLAILSLGIAMLWIIPYQEVALVEFHKDIKERCSIDYRI